MPIDRLDSLIFLSIPGLRCADVNAQRTPTLYEWANRGVLTEITPTFPCVTSCVQASMWTGTPPSEHGVIANGFFHRERQEVEFWVGHNDVIHGEPVWDALRRSGPGLRSAVWHAQNIKGASADFLVTPSPIHDPDGTTKLWCYSKPDSLYSELLGELGHFPLQHYWGPLSNIQSTRWILRAASLLHQRHAPRFHWIYVPHLDYAAQKFGPNSPQALASLTELDSELAAFEQSLAAARPELRLTFLAVGEYALTDVRDAIHPNRILRGAGLTAYREQPDGTEELDLPRCAAFAMVDHQLAHVYVNAATAGEREVMAGRVADLFRGVTGIAGVHLGPGRANIGMLHPRSGDVILVSDDAHWFAYYWWLDDARAPSFARTVDIHRKPGYDPVELFFDPKSRGIPLDASLVRGSHGAPVVRSQQRTALIVSTSRGEIDSDRTYRDTQMKALVLQLLGAA